MNFSFNNPTASTAAEDWESESSNSLNSFDSQQDDKSSGKLYISTNLIHSSNITMADVITETITSVMI